MLSLPLPEALGSRQSVLVGMALAVNVLFDLFGTEVPPTGFVAEGDSVLNNQTVQLYPC